MLCCPNCRAELRKVGAALKCENGHSFDIASSGYCNLLLGSKAGEYRGDSREMVAARRKFLDSGAYEKLRDAVCQTVTELLPEGHVNVIDCGCGEGYYTRKIAESIVHSGRTLDMLGADISKSATQYAAKRDKTAQYITASCYHLPVTDRCADLVLSLFAPAPAEELGRILKDDGVVLQVVPGNEHLWELKQAVYDEPYLNREDKHTLEGFALFYRKKLSYETKVEGSEQIEALFSMTPYYHRTPKEGMERLKKLDSIQLTLSFVLLGFRKEK